MIKQGTEIVCPDCEEVLYVVSQDAVDASSLVPDDLEPMEGVEELSIDRIEDAECCFCNIPLIRYAQGVLEIYTNHEWQ